MHRIKLLLIAMAALLACQPAIAQGGDEPRAVLVTGANSGIGLAITEYLAERGFHVYAGARKDEDLKRLDAMPNVSAVRLDVTRQDEVDAAAKFVAAQGRGLFGIVNNAGVASVAELIATSDEDVLWMHDVNVMGPLRVNRAFVPLLKESKGRTVTIGSLSNFVIRPSGGAYSMSKLAMQAYTEALALELASSGVVAGIVDPGSFQSRAREKVTIKMLTGNYDLRQPLTEEQETVLAGVQEAESKRKEPTEVAEQVFHFLTSDSPRRRYMAAPDSRTVETAIRAMLDWAVQMNASQPAYGLSRDRLVAMLDEFIAKQGTAAN